MELIITNITSIIHFIQQTEDISKFKNFLIDELNSILTLINNNINTIKTDNDNNETQTNNKYDKYISKAKALITKYQNSNQTQPLIIPSKHTFNYSELTSPKMDNPLEISDYKTLNNPLSQTNNSKLINKPNSYSNSISNGIYNKKQNLKHKKQISNTKRRELILSLNNIENPSTHIKNSKYKSFNNNFDTLITNPDNYAILNKEHIYKKSIEITDLLTHINTNDKLNTQLENVFGVDYVEKLINSNVNDGYIEQIQTEAKKFINSNSNINKPPKCIISSMQCNKNAKSYAEELLNMNNKLRMSNHPRTNSNEVHCRKKSNHSVNNNSTMVKSYEKRKNCSKGNKQLNKTVNHFKRN